MGDFKTAWKRVCGELDLHDFHFHDNRHTFCSNIIMAGGMLKHAKEMIGHKTLRMTDRYSHLEATRENIVQSALASHYAGPSEVTDTKPLFSPKQRKKDFKHTLEILIFLVVELEGIEPTTS